MLRSSLVIVRSGVEWERGLVLVVLAMDAAEEKRVGESSLACSVLTCMERSERGRKLRQRQSTGSDATSVICWLVPGSLA